MAELFWAMLVMFVGVVGVVEVPRLVEGSRGLCSALLPGVWWPCPVGFARGVYEVGGLVK